MFQPFIDPDAYLRGKSFRMAEYRGTDQRGKTGINEGLPADDCEDAMFFEVPCWMEDAV